MRFLAFLLIATFLLPSYSHAAPILHKPGEKRRVCPATDPTITFKGIDKIFVDTTPTFDEYRDARVFDNLLGQHAYLFLQQETTNALQKVFFDANHHLPVDSWIKIVSAASNPDSWEREESYALDMNFIISGRKDVLNGKPVNLASLGLQLYKAASECTTYRYVTETYPFIVPDTQEELKKRIYEGVLYLTKSLPSQFCASAHNNQSCNYAPPYQEPQLKQ